MTDTPMLLVFLIRKNCANIVHRDFLLICIEIIGDKYEKEHLNSGLEFPITVSLI